MLRDERWDRPESRSAAWAETVDRRSSTSRTGRADAAATAAAKSRASAVEILVGLPLNMRGEDTASTVDAREFAEAVAAASAVPVRLVDERLSTVSAHAALRDSGRSQRSSRSIVDQVAAVVLLQQALDVEKSTGRPPGTPVSQEPA